MAQQTASSSSAMARVSAICLRFPRRFASSGSSGLTQAATSATTMSAAAKVLLISAISSPASAKASGQLTDRYPCFRHSST